MRKKWRVRRENGWKRNDKSARSAREIEKLDLKRNVCRNEWIALGRRMRESRVGNFWSQTFPFSSHDNDHWKTAPFWNDQPFCFCMNANNNTYSCVRTINETHNFLYCEFTTGLVTFYNLRIGKYEKFKLRNSGHFVQSVPSKNLSFKGLFVQRTFHPKFFLPKDLSLSLLKEKSLDGNKKKLSTKGLWKKLEKSFRWDFFGQKVLKKSTEWSVWYQKGKPNKKIFFSRSLWNSK